MTIHPSQYAGRFGLRLWLLLTLAAAPAAAGLLPTFSKAFTPDAIGPGSTTTLRFDITNPDSSSGVSDLAFVDNLPASVVIAGAPQASTDCDNAILVAVAGDSTITFSEGMLGPQASCSISVDVTSATPGVHQNVSGDLTSSAGNSGSAVDDLTVDAARPGFSKKFLPDSVVEGDTSTLVFTIDNSLNDSNVDFLTFSDTLPLGMVVATPSNGATDCAGGLVPPGVTATPGASSISAQFLFVQGGGTCTVSVDVQTQAVGLLQNTSGELAGQFASSGKASASLEVTRPAFKKLFTDDPVPPGGQVTLEFTLTNFDRTEVATEISFTDDLDAALPGLEAVGLPNDDVCGDGSQIAGTSLLDFSGGTLAPEASCTFAVTLQVPASAPPGVYVNTTSPLSLTVGADQVVEDPAVDDLTVAPVPIFTKTFIDDPVTAGGTVTLRFEIVNTSSSFAATNLAFVDEPPSPLQTATSTPGPDPCGDGSTVTFTPFIDNPDGSDIPARITLADGVLAPNESCSFDLVLDVHPTTATGTYPNVTSELSVTIDGTPFFAGPAVDELVVVAAPELRKVFTDDPALPGGTVNLRFTLDLADEAPGSATDIEFTDDLDAVLSGLEAIGLPMNDVCGSGSQITGTGFLSFTGGSLAPGGSCSIDVTLQMPAEALPGTVTNTTSALSAMSLGIAVGSNAATADLEVGGLTFTKKFTDDPVVPGDSVTLEFSIDNLSPSAAATAMQFDDDLDATLDGLVALGLPLDDPCGAGSQLIGLSNDTFLRLIDGDLPALTGCTFSVVLQVPGGADAGDYPNATTQLMADVGGSLVLISPATDALAVIEPLSIVKEFKDDPVAPGDSVSLEFTLTNSASTGDVIDIDFSDDLDAVLSGLAAVGLPANDVCGAGSQITGTGLLSFTGGSLGAGDSCTFAVEVAVPPDAALGTVTNVTSEVTGVFNDLATTGPPANDDLTVAEAMCTAPDGESAVLANDTLFELLSVSVCQVIEVGPAYVVGSGGILTLRAGERVLFLDGTAIEGTGLLSVGIDPDLQP